MELRRRAAPRRQRDQNRRLLAVGHPRRGARPAQVFVQDRVPGQPAPVGRCSTTPCATSNGSTTPPPTRCWPRSSSPAKARPPAHRPQQRTWREEKYWSDPLRMINFATLQWGKGSGKDHICRIARMRVAYLLMCLKARRSTTGCPSRTPSTCSTSPPAPAQAQQAFFMPITRAVKKGWFGQVPAQAEPDLLRQEHRSVSGHSDAESQEGLNLLLGIADEIDAFKSKKEMVTRKGASAREPTKSAEGILNMMRTSASTRFPEVFKNVRISYPRYLGSTIQQLTNAARADYKERGQASRHYVSGPMATWEVNPRVPAGRPSPRTTAKTRSWPAPSTNAAPTGPSTRTSATSPPSTPRSSSADQLPLTVTYSHRPIRPGSEPPRLVPVYHFASPVPGTRGHLHHARRPGRHRRPGRYRHGPRRGLHRARVVTEDEDGALHTIRETRPVVKVDFVHQFQRRPSPPTRPGRSRSAGHGNCASS
jgi:hypothetical protein